MISDIKVVIDSIVKIFSESDEEIFAKSFENLRENLDSESVDVLYALKSHFGGAGTFNDLVLHKNGQMLKSENDELDDLKHKLYDLLTEEIGNVKQSGARHPQGFDGR